MAELRSCGRGKHIEERRRHSRSGPSLARRHRRFFRPTRRRRRADARRVGEPICVSRVVKIRPRPSVRPSVYLAGRSCPRRGLGRRQLVRGSSWAGGIFCSFVFLSVSADRLASARLGSARLGSAALCWLAYLTRRTRANKRSPHRVLAEANLASCQRACAMRAEPSASAAHEMNECLADASNGSRE